MTARGGGAYCADCDHHIGVVLHGRRVGGINLTAPFESAKDLAWYRQMLLCRLRPDATVTGFVPA